MIAFRVYPGRDNWMAAETEAYWQVRIYPTRRSLLRFWGKVRNALDKDDKFTAIVMPRSKQYCDTQGNWTVEPFLGYVLFRKGQIDAEIIAHESVHMGMEYLRRRGHSVRFHTEIETKEERLAYAIGNCVSQLSDAIWQHKLWTNP